MKTYAGDKVLTADCKVSMNSSGGRDMGSQLLVAAENARALVCENDNASEEPLDEFSFG